MDLNGNRAEELLEEGGRFRKLGLQISSDLVHGGLREYQANEAKLTEN
jgi:hypothetical protein